MKPRRGRVVAFWIATLGTCALVVCAVTLWDRLEVEYRLYRLRTNPDYLPSLLEPSMTAAKGEAVDRYLDSEQGKTHLLGLIVRRFENEFSESLTQIAADSKNPLEVGVLLIIGATYVSGCRFRDSMAGPRSGYIHDAKADFLLAVRPYFQRLMRVTCQYQSSEQLQVTFLPGDEAAEQSGCYSLVRNGRIKGVSQGRKDSKPPDWVDEEYLETLKAAVGLVYKRSNDG